MPSWFESSEQSPSPVPDSGESRSHPGCSVPSGCRDPGTSALIALLSERIPCRRCPAAPCGMGTVPSCLSCGHCALHPERCGVSLQAESFVAMVIQTKNLYYGNFSKTPLFSPEPNGTVLGIVWARSNRRADFPQPELLSSSCVEGWGCQLGLLFPDTAQGFYLTLERFLGRLSAFVSSRDVIGFAGHSGRYEAFVQESVMILLTKACILKVSAVEEEGHMK